MQARYTDLVLPVAAATEQESNTRQRAVSARGSSNAAGKAEAHIIDGLEEAGVVRKGEETTGQDEVIAVTCKRARTTG